MTVAMTSADSWPLCLPRFGTPRRPERRTRGHEVGLIAESLGKPLMPWQQHVADVALEIDPATGRFAYREIILTVPRRSGKSTLLLALLIHRMLAMGRPQVAAFTMQNALQARMRMRREWHSEILSRSPALAKVYSFTGQPGAEALMFTNGSRIEVTASTASSGHGATLDLAVVDEAFDQPDDRLEQAFRPAIRTQPDAQLWWVSTAGGPSDRWFRSKVEAGRALVGDSHGTAIFEWSAPDDADASDPAVWWECMPALGYIRSDGSGLTEADIAEDYRGMCVENENGFRRAYLNQWVDLKTAGAFDLAAWHDLTDTTADRRSGSFGVATAPDRSWSAVAVAWARPDGLTQALLLDYRPGASWVDGRVRELRSKHGGQAFCDTPSRGLVAGATEPSGSVQAQAHNLLADAVEAGALRHGGEAALTTSVSAARWRAQGDTRVLDRKGSADISPLIAVALAMHGLSSKPAGGWMVGL